LGKYLSGAQHTVRTAQGEDFQVILVVKMETRHPVEEPFASEFPAMCNHCGVMTAKKAAAIEMPFASTTLVGPGKHLVAVDHNIIWLLHCALRLLLPTE